MNSYAIERFWKLFYALPPDIQKQARQAFHHFQADAFHPGLIFEEVNKRRGIWSARINDDYRALGYRQGSNITWFWIGRHDEYDRIIHSR